MREEIRVVIDEEVENLKEVRFINDIKYPVWQPNFIMVKNYLGK